MKTGKNADDIIDLKNDAKNALNDIDDIVPKDAKYTVKSLSKKLEKTTKSVGKKELKKATKNLKKKIEKVAPKDLSLMNKAILGPVSNNILKKGTL